MLKWLPIAIDFGLVLVAICIGCYLTRTAVSRMRGNSRCASFLDVLPPCTPAELKRLLTSDLRTVSPSGKEYNNLEPARAKPGLAMSLLCWRRTQLSASILFNIATFVITLYTVVDDETLGVSVQEDELFSDELTLRRRFKERILGLISLCQTVIAMFFYTFAVYKWHDLERSRILVVGGWVLVFFMPFIFFTVPWLDIDSPQGYVKDLCKYLVDMLGSLPQDDFSFIYDKLPMTSSGMCAGNSNDIAKRFTEKVTVIGGGAFGEPMMTFIGMALSYIVYFPFVVASFQVMKTLAPGVLGVLMGMQSGLMLSKIMFPGVRLTSWLLIILQACTIPVIMFLCAVILVVVGTVPAMVTAVTLTASMSLNVVFPHSLLRASTAEDTMRVMRKFGRISLVLKVIGLGFLVLGVLSAPHLMALADEGIDVIKKALKPLTVARMATSFLAGMFTSKVVFVDIVLYIIMSTYIGCFEDSVESREDAMNSLLDLCSVFDRYEKTYENMRGSANDLDLEMQKLPTLSLHTPVPTQKEAPAEAVASPPASVVTSPLQASAVHTPSTHGQAVSFKSSNMLEEPMLQSQSHMDASVGSVQQPQQPRAASMRSNTTRASPTYNPPQRSSQGWTSSI